MNNSKRSDHILTELIQGGSETLLSAIHKLVNSIWNKEKLPEQYKESIIVPVHSKGDKTDCNYRGISLLSASYQTVSNVQRNLYVDKVFHVINMEFYIEDQLVRYWSKMWVERDRISIGYS
jgi:hypothetical protein